MKNIDLAKAHQAVVVASGVLFVWHEKFDDFVEAVRADEHARLVRGEAVLKSTTGDFPATKTVHCVSGPVQACDLHASKLVVVLSNLLGQHVGLTAAQDGAPCSNCENEKKAANQRAQEGGA